MPYSYLKHILTPPQHPSSNEQGKRFFDEFKRRLSKARSKLHNEEALKNLLIVYSITSNPNTNPAKSLVESARRKYIFDELLRDKNTHREKKKLHLIKNVRNITGPFEVGDKVYFKNYKCRQESWENDCVIKSFDNMIYLIRV